MQIFAVSLAAEVYMLELEGIREISRNVFPDFSLEPCTEVRRVCIFYHEHIVLFANREILHQRQILKLYFLPRDAEFLQICERRLVEFVCSLFRWVLRDDQ